MDEYLGVIKIFGGSFAPIGWMICAGQEMSIRQYPSLFATIGTTYGGDGVTTFCLPDYRGRSPLGLNAALSSMPFVGLGVKSGAVATQMNASDMPAHSHDVVGTVQIPVNDSVANVTSPVGAYLAQPSTRMFSGTPGLDNGGNVYYQFSVDQAGSPTPAPVAIMCPFLAVNYIINVSGQFEPPTN